MKTNLSLMVIFIIFLSSCRRDNLTEIASSPEGLQGELSLSEVKSWFMQQQKLQNSSTKPGFHLEKLDLMWSQAVSIPAGKSNYWLIGLPGQPTINQVKQGYRKIAFLRDSLGNIRTRILEIVPDILYWQRKRTVSTGDFSGRVYIYDEFYHYLGGKIYSRGRQVGESKLKTSDPNPSGQLQTNKVDVAVDCEWYDSNYLDAEGNVVIHSDRICNYTVYDDGFYPDEGNGGGGGDGSALGSGGGGMGPGPAPEPPDPSNLPGEDHDKVNPQDYVRCFGNISNAGATMSVTLYVQQPLPGTTFNVGPNSVGHVAIGLTKTNGSNSVTQTLGYYPDASGKAKMHAPAKVVDNGGLMDYNLSITYQVTASQFQAILNYVNTPPPTYDLVQNNCTNFAIQAVTNGGITPPYAYSNVGLDGAGGVQTAMTPAGLGDSISRMQGQPGVNTNGGTTPNSKGPCN